MRKYLLVLSFLAFVFSAFPSLAICDVIKLKNGQTYKGTVTAEEKDRVQVKLEDTGTRIWFSRDQIGSLEKSAAKEEPKKGEPEKQADKQEDKQPASQDAATDDVSRARELLKKMREQQIEEAAANKKKDAHPTLSPSESEQETAVAPPPAEGSEVEKLIDTFRNGQYYDRLKAGKRLGELKAKEAIPHMIHFLDDDDFGIRQAANEALIQITGQNFGFNPKDRGSVRAAVIEKWKDWYNAQKKKEASAQFKSLW